MGVGLNVPMPSSSLKNTVKKQKQKTINLKSHNEVGKSQNIGPPNHLLHEKKVLKIAGTINLRPTIRVN